MSHQDRSCRASLTFMVCLAAAACTGSGGMSSSLPEGESVCFRLRAVPTGSALRPPSWVRVLEVTPEESVPPWYRYYREPSRVTAITAVVPEAHGWVQTNQVGWSDGDRLTIVTRDPDNGRLVRLHVWLGRHRSNTARVWIRPGLALAGLAYAYWRGGPLQATQRGLAEIVAERG